MTSDIQTLYYAWDITHRRSTSDEGRFTGVLTQARVDLNPHQVEAALFAFKSPLSKGAILADEVGLGKTIEAGIILSEMWAEGRRRMIIIVPASLRTQWKMELLDKFRLPSTLLDSATWGVGQQAIERGEANIYICSYHFAHSHAPQLGRAAWDLVVFDEAHTLRGVYKTDNVMARALRSAFQDYKKVLLTATPLQNNLKELYGLISIIDPTFFSSIDTFAEQYNAVTTRDTATYGTLRSRLARVVHRTLRRQVQEYVNFTRRKAIVEEYRPAPAEQRLAAHLEAYLTRDDTLGLPERGRQLLTLMVRRIMASSIYALSFTLGRFIQRLELYKATGQTTFPLLVNDDDNPTDDYAPDATPAETMMPARIDEEIALLKALRQEAQAITDETKALRLIATLQLSLDKTQALGGERKALIFTESRRTQDYLFRFLQTHGYEGKVVLFNGTNEGDEARRIYRLWLQHGDGASQATGNAAVDRRQALVDAFHQGAEIMIATEAGAEGINLQFCSIVVNYDMPWNPQRVEQRIGRCHRYGQKHDVVVVNFLNRANYADCRVYELLDRKFKLFDGVFGASDEILGAMDAGLDIERRLRAIYSTCRTHEEIAEAFDQLQSELDQVIKERITHTRKALLENFDEEVVSRLRIRQEKDAQRIDRFTRHLWHVATSVLEHDITDIDEATHTFTLRRALAPDIPAATYRLGTNFNYAHPLGQYVLRAALATRPADAVLAFDLASHPFRVPLLEKYKGRSGYACLYSVSADNQHDREQQIIAVARTDEGETLPPDFATRLLEVDCTAHACNDLEREEKLAAADYQQQYEAYAQALAQRTNTFVNYEIDKYEMWADDQLVPLRSEVMTLSREHDAIRRQIRKTHDAALRLQLKQTENQKARLLSKKRERLFAMEDEGAERVDKMAEQLRASMTNHITATRLCRFRWTIAESRT